MIPFGYCQCGCGERTEVRRGKPNRYIRGHQSRRPAVEYVVDESGCWIWRRYITKKGYGMMRPYGSKRMYNAHIIYYERVKGPVPDGLQLDHLCRVRRCVNPDHLEPVTNTENQRRGRKPKLTLEQVREIRNRSHIYGSTLALAREFGVDVSTISRVRNQADRYWIDSL